MDSLLILASENRPAIQLNAHNNVFEFSGKSLIEAPEELYLTVENWFTEYAKKPNLETNVVFDFQCFNIASSKCLLKVLYSIDNIFAAGNNVKITWCHKENEDDMIEAGHDFASMVKIPFEFIEYPSTDNSDRQKVAFA